MRNVVSCVFRRPWLGLPLGLWVLVSVLYYWWLISRISILEMQNQRFRTQLRLAPSMRILADDYTSNMIPDAAGTVCETIHISLVCMGKCGRTVTTMLKSLFYHRQNPLHIHFIVDRSSQDIVRTLFETWDLPDLKYTFYNAESKLSKVSWIPNTHYSGVYSFVKLLYPEILPVELKHVIVLDSDLTFLSDVAELWDMFRNMTDDQLIGLVENESNWYYEGSRWPAIGRGYNSGVMLLNLRAIRARTNWTALWSEALNDNIGRLTKLALGDQDIINAIISRYPKIVYNVSCQYNVQLSTKTLSKSCYGEDPRNVKVIHWNSPTKYGIKVRDADYFRSRHHSFVGLDGNLLREKLHLCWAKPDHNVTQEARPDLCSSFRAASRAKLRTHIYYIDYSYRSEDNFDVTLVLQLSMDRLQFLERLVKHWEGPISAAIYLSECDVARLESYIQEWTSLSSRRNIGYHLVFRHDAVHYPVNYLRNVALEHVTTPYVFLMDVDFVPSEGLYYHLRKAIQLINPYPQKKCLVVAAFESQRYRAVPPRTKEQLVSRLRGSGRAPDVVPFRALEWPRGHRATNYTRWVTATAPYEVEWEADYEPYLVVHRSVPKYDTRFSGFGWNKVSHSVLLRAQGYRCVVLPDAYVVHTTHAPSPAVTAFRQDPHYRVCLALLKNEFLEDLGRKYNMSFAEHKPDDIIIGDEKKLIIDRVKDTE